MPKTEMDRLGDEICELSAHIAAATYRFLVKLAEFDEAVGWGGWGLKSCAHWLNWRCGIDLRTARDYLRVAHALAGLPLISAAFSRGEITYSKVRAITRVATPQTEQALLDFAIVGTTQHVEKIVRGYRRSVPTELDDANDAYRKRSVEIRYDDDGSVLITARLSPEEGALVVKAIEKVRQELSKSNRAQIGSQDGSREPPMDRADALAEIARRELVGEKRRASGAYQVFVTVDAGVLRGGDGECHVNYGSGLASETARRLVCDGSFIGVVRDERGNVLDVGRKTRAITPPIRRALEMRDEGCRYPGCTNYQFTDGHHIEHWIDGGVTALQNLVLLCPFHHRLIHEGGYSMDVRPDGAFTFFRPDGCIVDSPAIQVDPGGVEDANAALGLAIDGKTTMAKWQGERCDYGVAVEGLLRRNRIGSWATWEKWERENGSREPSPDSEHAPIG